MTYERQLLLEEEMISLGVKRYRKENLKAREDAHESTTPAGIQLIRKSCSRVSKRIEELNNKRERGEVFNHPADAVHALCQVPSDVSSFLALKGAINHLSTPVGLVKVAQEIGGFIEDEARFSLFKDQNPALFGVITRDLAKRTTNYRKQKRVLAHSANKAAIEWTNWTINTKLRLGQLLLELICDETKLFNIRKVTISGQKRKTVYMLEATKEALAWIDKKNSICELLSPVKMPCISSPRRWTSLYDGGYRVYTNMHLIKTGDVAYKKELESRDLSKVFSAVNTIQETAWKINKKVFSVMDTLYSTQSSCSVVPEFHELSMPRPYPKEGTVDDKISWKREATIMHQDNLKRKTKRVQFSQLMWMARKFKDEERFYFPHTLDFRGRLYANTAFLNPQGEDNARGLLQFAEKKQLGDSGLSWLAVYGSNCFGNDKVTLEDRYQWSYDNLEEIIRAGSNPLDETWWMEANKPWQFLAFCMEFRSALLLSDPTKFMSSIPVTVDGSCNGLQHFAGMLRDEEGGKSVNLLPNDTPADIYDIVRQEVIRNIKLDGDTPEAQLWNYGDDINRKMVKRPVMTTPYGVSLYGMRDQIAEELKKQLDNSVKYRYTIDSTTMNVACRYLARHIYDSIGEVVKSAHEGMVWLQKVAQLLASKEQCVYWTVPTGLYVKQKYVKSKLKKVVSILNGRTISLFSNNFEGDSLNKQRQVNGIAPNFVHSMDASHLMLTIIGARNDYGIESFSVVHDSFGTHAADMEALSMVLREKFVEIYSQDVLNNLKEEIQEMTGIELPELPKYGTLDINQVLDSEFLFS